MRIFSNLRTALFFCLLSVAECGLSSENYLECQSDTAWKILNAENLRLESDQVLTAELPRLSPRCQVLALRALGRIGVASSVERISPFLKNDHAPLRSQAATALGLIGTDAAKLALRQTLITESEPAVRAALLLALGRAGDESDLEILTQALAARGSDLEAAAGSQALGLLFLKSGPTWVVESKTLEILAGYLSRPARISMPAAFALARYKGNPANLPAEPMLAAASSILDGDTRAYLMRSLGKLRGHSAAESAFSLLKDVASRDREAGLRVESLRALGAWKKDSRAAAVVARSLNDSDLPVRIQALETLFGLESEIASEVVLQLQSLSENSPSVAERHSALGTLAKLSPKDAESLIKRGLQSADPVKIRAAVAAASYLARDADLTNQVYRLLSHPDRSVVQDVLGTLKVFSDSELLNLPGGLETFDTTLVSLLKQADLGIVASVSELAAEKQRSALAPALADVYFRFESADSTEAKVSILQALAVIGSLDQLQVLETALDDDEKKVVEAAANAFQKITGKDVSDRIPVVSRVRAVTPQMDDIQEALAAQIIVKTRRGSFLMAFEPTAPLTAASIFGLVQKGFYNGTTFHRVVSHFVAQGGDPRGDGYGGPGFLIRDEVGIVSHLRGTVGIATAGKDTGGCQFFVNLGPNLHLDGNYTVFARVISGMEVVDKLEMGDVIYSLEVVSKSL